MTTTAPATNHSAAAGADADADHIAYIKTIGLTTNQSGRGFTNPYDCAFTADGRILVLNHCDTARAALTRVGVMTWDEEYLGEFTRGYGGGDGQWMLPIGLALDSQQRAYVTDEHLSRVVVIDLDGNFVTQWGQPGSEPGQFRGAAGIAITPDDTVYVADQHNHRIQRFTADGQLLSHFGEPGAGPGQFNMPWGLGLDADGNLHVADWRNNRIQKLAPDGQFLAAYGADCLSRPSAVCVDSAGYSYVADWGNESVRLFNPDGELLQTLRGQATLSKWAQDYMNVNDDERNTRAIADLTPELPPHFDTPYLVSSQIEPYFWGPVAVRLDAAERLFVVEANRHRIQIYQRRQS